MTRYLIGIDLGTTNSALAYIDLASGKAGTVTAPTIQPFPVPQLVAPAEIAPRPLLPSFLYLPGPTTCRPARRPCRGTRSAITPSASSPATTARKVPGRLVTSAKSWLCHAGVDRSAPLLPWSAPPDVPRISPVEASTRYLRHLVEAWNHVMASKHADYRLEKQAVVLTVPASFDDVARTLTVEAARKAGLENLTLLEEPQAAFYCWLATHTPQEAAQLKPGDHCLVVDVGGGTTDFSLIQAVEEQGRAGLPPPGGRRPPAARRRQHGPGPGQVRRDEAARRRQARRRPVRHADAGLPAGKETLLGANAAGDTFRHGHGPRPVGHRRHAARDADAGRRAPHHLRRLLPAVPRDAEPQRGAAPACTRWACRTSATRRSPGTWRLPEEAPHRRRHRRLAPSAILFNGGVFSRPPLARARRRGAASVVRRAGTSLAAAGADEPVARPRGRLGRGPLRLAQAHRRPAHRRRHRALVLHRRRGRDGQTGMP